MLLWHRKVLHCLRSVRLRQMKLPNSLKPATCHRRLRLRPPVPPHPDSFRPAPSPSVSGTQHGVDAMTASLTLCTDAHVSVLWRGLGQMRYAPQLRFCKELKKTRRKKREANQAHPEASQKPAKSQPEASQKPARSQKASQKPGANQTQPEASQKPAKSQPEASQKPARVSFEGARLTETKTAAGRFAKPHICCSHTPARSVLGFESFAGRGRLLDGRVPETYQVE